MSTSKEANTSESPENYKHFIKILPYSIKINNLNYVPILVNQPEKTAPAVFVLESEMFSIVDKLKGQKC